VTAKNTLLAYRGFWENLVVRRAAYGHKRIEAAIRELGGRHEVWTNHPPAQRAGGGVLSQELPGGHGVVSPVAFSCAIMINISASAWGRFPPRSPSHARPSSPSSESPACGP
jgi:hypothetical protein